MKIAICSDLHLEFGPLKLENPGNIDVLVLSGDIIIGELVRRFRNTDPAKPSTSPYYAAQYLDFVNFFKQVSLDFPRIIWVAGNHEYYGGDFPKEQETLRKFIEQFPNVSFLEKETLDIGDVKFFGATFWTDMNKSDPITLELVANLLNDFKTIRMNNEGYRAFRPMDSVKEHKYTLKVLQEQLDAAKGSKWVVVGHHAPSNMSTHPRFSNHAHMNGAYSSDLSEFILDNPQIRLWTHGHTHCRFDYMIGSTRIVCNPRGYVGYEVPRVGERFDLSVIDV